MKKNIITVILLALLTGGAGFFAGMNYQRSKQPTIFRQLANGQGNRTGQFKNGANRTGFKPASGEIIASDDKSITVKLTDGGSKIVILSEKTEINRADKATKEDLKVGEKVAVFGQENPDGSLTAQNIQLNPVFRQITRPTP